MNSGKRGSISRILPTVTFPVAMLLIAGGAGAQPTFFYTPVSQSMTPDGQTFVGPLYDAAANAHWVHRVNRNGAHQYTTDRAWKGDVVKCNADATLLATEMNDAENLAGFGSDRTLAHVLQLGSNWTNLGLTPNGNSCDFSLNAVGGIARNTNQVLISGWSTRECGPYRAWLFDPSNGEFTTLPVSNSGPPLFADARSARGDSISDDGTVIVGYDNNYDPTSHGLVGPRATVWRKSSGVWTQTILDLYGGSAVAVSGDGNVIIGRMSVETMQSTFATTYRTPVRWVRVGDAWVPQNLGGLDTYRPTVVSADGSTIAGEGFIWRPSLAGGIATPLSTYLASVGAVFNGLTIGSPAGASVSAISADGNSLVVAVIDRRNPCLSTYGSGVIDLAGTACAPPRVIFDPSSMEVASPTIDYGLILNAFFFGTWELSYQWQKESAPGQWVDLEDDHCGEFNPNLFDYRGTSTYQLRVGYLNGTWAGNYRCVATNPCGVATTNPASLTEPCAADYNQDGGVDGMDVESFFVDWADGGLRADVNQDGGVDGQDVEFFFVRWEAGGC